MANEGTIGYNIANARTLQDNISDAFDSVKEKIATPWSDLQNTLHTEWVGEDEVSYEKEFVKKVNQLYGSAKWVTDVCCGTVETTLENWVKFQDNNLIEGAAGGAASNSIGNRSYPRLEDLPSTDSYSELEAIQAEAEQLDDSTTRGLTNGTSSASIIQESVTKYVTDIQNEVSGLFDVIKADNAFFGDQVEKINGFIARSGEAVGEVVTSVQDLHDLLEELAGSRYTEEQNSAIDQTTEARTSINTSVTSMESRWGGTN